MSARAWGPLSRSRVAAPALADVIVDYATQAASRQQRERRGSRRKICRERGPQLVGAKVNALSGFRTNYQDTRGVVESWRGGRTRSAGQLVETPRGGRRPVRRRRTLGRMRGSRVGTDTGNGGRAPVPFRSGPCAGGVLPVGGSGGLTSATAVPCCPNMHMHMHMHMHMSNM